MTTRYRGYTISKNLKPVPSRAFDFDFSHDDYDGAPDSGDHRCGAAKSEAAAKTEIDEQIAETDDQS